jgi:lysophospholipase L1-like esterase
MRRALLSRIATIVASGAAVAAVVIPGTAATEMASPPAQAHGSPKSGISAMAGKKYVALGSSYAAGPDAASVQNLPCLRTSDNYPHQVARAAGLRLTDASCSSATTANVLSKPQPPTGRVPQIAAVTPDTGLVTITVGGNDIDYIGRLTAISCANSLTTATHSTRRCVKKHVVRSEPDADDFGRVQKSLTELIIAVHVRAPRARVLLVDYPPVLEPGRPLCAKLPLTAPQAAQTARVFEGLAAATARAAERGGARLVRASKAGATHTVCSADPWLNGFELPIPYHPTASGKAGMARLVLTALR